MKPQTSVVLPATKVTSQACCSELLALVLTSQVLLSLGGERSRRHPPKGGAERRGKRMHSVCP